MNCMTTQEISAQLAQKLTVQRSDYQRHPAPELSLRIQKLKQLKQALMTHQDAIIHALAQDYGHRSKDDTLISDILPCINNINYTLKRLKKWMKPESRHAGLLLAPAKIKVQYQPLGVIGIIVPWNFPVMLSIGPLITALAAGNRVMLKLSEFTPATNQALTAMLESIYSPEWVTIIEGEADVAAAFSALPFDHLLFTGSTRVGKHVMAAAAQNLTPVTLELGGKSPVIIAEDMPIATAVERLIYGKCLNAGQICVSPDYVLCPEHQVAAFVEEYKRQFQRMYRGDLNHNADYSAVINQSQFQRLLDTLADAKQQGANITSANDQGIDPQSRKIPTQLITNTTDQMLVMQQEIFGPLLPIIGYQSLTQAIDYVNQRPRPLALYLMSFDAEITEQVLQQTHSGGVCVNETLFHVAADDAPFGGIGASGMGHYHGKEGFQTFSHAKTILSRGKLNTGKLVHPPYGWMQKLLIKFFMR